MKTALTGLLPEQIREIISEQPAFRAKQIFKNIYNGRDSLEKMTDLSKDLRVQLSDNFTIYNSQIIETQESKDGTKKYGIKLKDDTIIEAVLLEDNGRLTSCLSTQVGCAMGCTFCKTAESGLIRNLTAAEIVQEFLLLSKENGRISNIVFMGMGEPLANYDNLIQAIKIITHSGGLDLGIRKITISTCGLIPGILKLAEDLPQVKLAISLNNADNNTRKTIMPVTKKYSLEQLKETLIQYQEITGKRVTFEYVLLKGENDSKSDIKNLRDFTRGLSCLVNVIPLNSKAGSKHNTPSGKDTAAFIKALENCGIKATRRASKGQDIDGACGQLAGDRNI